MYDWPQLPVVFAAGVGAGMPMQLLVATLLCHAEDRFESR
jgi:hypothetical protein